VTGVRLPDGWTADMNGDGQFVVQGPCPTCLGDAYGPSVPEVVTSSADASALLLAVIAPPPRKHREILAACCCGSEHGKDGAQSCGREWVVRLSYEEPA